MTGIYRGVGTSGTGISVEDLVASKVNISGDTMTGYLTVPAGATGAQVPQRQEIDTLLALKASTSALALKANIASPTFTGIVGGIDATMIVNTPAGGISAITVQSAINELDTEKANIASPTFTGTVGGITGTMVGNTPAGNIAATTVQAALNELDTEKAAIAQTMYIGTTAVAINRSSASLALTGITSIDGNAATATTIAGTSSTKLPTIGCTQATGALTFTATSLYLDFRSTTLTDGTITTVLAAPSNLVLPSGGTLGAVTTVQARIIVVELNNAGTAELAVINLAGGNDLSETGVISTTAISATSTASNVFYSTTARTNVAYRVVGAIDAVNTAGAWASPVLVQGAGGNALMAMSSSGYGQTWQAVTRTSGTTYYNQTNKPIDITISGVGGGALGSISATINGLSFNIIQVSTGTGYGAYVRVPAGMSYIITDVNISTRNTYELR